MSLEIYPLKSANIIRREKWFAVLSLLIWKSTNVSEFLTLEVIIWRLNLRY